MPPEPIRHLGSLLLAVALLAAPGNVALSQQIFDDVPDWDHVCSEWREFISLKIEMLERQDVISVHIAEELTEIAAVIDGRCIRHGSVESLQLYRSLARTLDEFDEQRRRGASR